MNRFVLGTVALAAAWGSHARIAQSRHRNGPTKQKRGVDWIKDDRALTATVGGLGAMLEAGEIGSGHKGGVGLQDVTVIPLASIAGNSTGAPTIVGEYNFKDLPTTPPVHANPGNITYHEQPRETFLGVTTNKPAELNATGGQDISGSVVNGKPAAVTFIGPSRITPSETESSRFPDDTFSFKVENGHLFAIPQHHGAVRLEVDTSGTSLDTQDWQPFVHDGQVVGFMHHGEGTLHFFQPIIDGGHLEHMPTIGGSAPLVGNGTDTGHLEHMPTITDSAHQSLGGVDVSSLDPLHHLVMSIVSSTSDPLAFAAALALRAGLTVGLYKGTLLVVQHAPKLERAFSRLRVGIKSHFFRHDEQATGAPAILRGTP